ncbi:MAG: pyrroloquinoline quinone precursor peptide PqqA [Rhodospirillum sp.]|nr:pyrroloquinoline quinone precursor peptide PqqA [Rhodospirillum sp.]MCF8490168.1 pyrroloquinoline quinone precursor peptide PqqA [Rhodospirillum sp.]MCF8501895.1 pyrroloquinoline quinone precursor peptide PqqA [Rhodospirillum sp.]
MTWTAPIVEEIACGMEINMYASEGDGEDFPY